MVYVVTANTLETNGRIRSLSEEIAGKKKDEMAVLELKNIITGVEMSQMESLAGWRWQRKVGELEGKPVGMICSGHQRADTQRSVGQ